MDNTLKEKLTNQLPEFPFQYDYDLAVQTYFKVGGPADAYVELADHQDIQKLVVTCRQQDIPLTVLGGASNVLVSDEGIRGVVLKITDDHFEVLEQESQHGKISVGAGMKTALFVRNTVDAGFAGLEYFLGVPGMVGGAIYNNAHYLESLIGEYVHRVKVVSESGELEWLAHDQLDFGYDSSRFQNTKEVILAAEFMLPRGDADQSKAKIAEATRYRASTQPLGEPSSGCIFQNVPNTPALQRRFPQFKDKSHISGGFLIDQAGLKNEHVGDVYVSDIHAAFFVNKGEGTAADVRALIDKVKQKVQVQFGVTLEEEIFYLS